MYNGLYDTLAVQTGNDAVNGLNKVAHAALHNLFPDDYEDFRMRIQIYGKMEGMIMDIPLVIMPTAFQQNSIARSKVIDTFGGKAVINSPYESSESAIMLQGSIGPTFRAMYFTDFQQVSGNSGTPVKKIVPVNGYGFIRRVDKLVKLSRSYDDYGFPRETYLVNTMYNEVNKVVITSFEVSISDQRNFIWNYNIQMRKAGELGDDVASRLVQTSIKEVAIFEAAALVSNLATRVVTDMVSGLFGTPLATASVRTAV